MNRFAIEGRVITNARWKKTLSELKIVKEYE